ncbi:hypothetical protein PMAG_a0350 [Pseudoalteromonas mariniglutinosa NCIMB 1770]|nr:hypothetical protein [Pseudoalteromonas mariniglutinosa NCIMB 1770]
MIKTVSQGLPFFIFKCLISQQTSIKYSCLRAKYYYFAACLKSLKT